MWRTQGIQDGTLPAEVETAVSDAANSSSVRASSGNPGGTSLDRLVLNQLVTVLQATSALSGAGHQSIADSSHPARASQVCHESKVTSFIHLSAKGILATYPASVEGAVQSLQANYSLQGLTSLTVGKAALKGKQQQLFHDNRHASYSQERSQPAQQ